MEEIGIEEFNKLQKQPLSLGNEFHSLFLDDVSPIVNIEKQKILDTRSKIKSIQKSISELS